MSYSPAVSGGRLQETIEETLDHLARQPGVRQAGATVGQMVDSFDITAGYFEAAGMSFVAGRPLTPTDVGRRGVVINEALVNRHFGGRAGIGDLVQVGDSVVPGRRHRP